MLKRLMPRLSQGGHQKITITEGGGKEGAQKRKQD